MSESIRVIILPLLLGISILTVFRIKVSVLTFRKVFVPYIIIFFIGLLIQALFHEKINLFLAFFLLAPFVGYYIFINSFNLRILYLSFYALCTFLIYYFLVHGTFLFIFSGLSGNYVSVFLLLFTSLIGAISLKQTDKDFGLVIMCLLTFVLCLLAQGRSGTLISLILLLYSLYAFFIKDSNLKIKFLFLVSIIIIFFLSIDYLNVFIENSDQLEIFEKFNKKGLESRARDDLREEYLSHMDSYLILTGYDFDYNQLFVKFGLNPHNSYIKLHSQVGIASIYFIIIIFVSMLKLLNKNRFLFLLFCAIILRGWTDTFLFFGFYDFILAFFIFCSSLPISKKTIE